jgi:transcriptional regulator with XRE-family HTH domain
MEINTNVADTVRAEMARSRVTQGKLAQQLHLSQAAVSRRLKGEVAFNADELIVTALIVGVPVGAFFESTPAEAASPHAASAGVSLGGDAA